MAVDYYERNGLGRVIDREEALEIIKSAEKAGLVLQPSNAQKIVNLCCCCGCCCMVLKSIKRHPSPGTLVSSPFVATLDIGTCKGCGICADRCQMEALRLEGEKITFHAERCIGCGLCVSTCPTGSFSLHRKIPEEQRNVPSNVFESTLELGRKRGKLSPTTLAKLQLKSKMDRLLASRKRT
jgi:ferredoxin